MRFSSQEETQDSNVPSNTSSHTSITGNVLYRRSSQETIQSYLSNSSMHTTSTVTTHEEEDLSGPSSGQGPDRDFPIPDHKSSHSLEKLTFGDRNQSLSAVYNIREPESDRSSIVTSTPTQELRSLSLPSFEDEAVSSLPSTPRSSAYSSVTDPSPRSSLNYDYAISAPLDDLLAKLFGDSQPSATMEISKADKAPIRPASFLPPPTDRLDTTSRSHSGTTGTVKGDKGVRGLMTDFLNSNKQPDFTTPHDLVHLKHADLNPSTGGFTGLPQEWQQPLQDSGISKSDQERNRPTPIEIVKYQEGGGDVRDEMGLAPAQGSSRRPPISGAAPAAEWWDDLISEDVRAGISKSEQKRQSIIFELIKSEMRYVRDLENIDIMYVQPLRSVEPPIIPRERLSTFITDVFHNFGAIHLQHRKLLDRLHAIQQEEHPVIDSVTAAIFDAALNWRDEYMEYIMNSPIAEYRIVDEMENNPAFKDFVEQCTRHPDANRLDMKNFVNRPISRLARYTLLLLGIMEASAEGHEDHDSIPHVIDLIKSLFEEAQPGIASARLKVELWRYNSNLVFKPGETVDMDLLAENRSLIHTGKLLRQPDTGFNWSGWSELFVLLFDNYLVFTKPKEKDGVMKYHVDRRPILLDLLTLENFTDPPTQRGTGLLRVFGGGNKGDNRNDAQANTPGLSPKSTTNSRVVHPCTILHTGRLGGLYTVYAESARARSEWKDKLQEAIGLRKVVQESKKVFEVETLSSDTFVVPSKLGAPTNHSWNMDNALTGKVTCSVPFTTGDGRALVAVGCAEGVWIGFRHLVRPMRRVLHLKMVTQCAMLEDFGIFLVLADKSLFAYHIEALVPTSPLSLNTPQTPQKLNGSKDVHFFRVGNLGGRTLVIYMKKKGLDSVFRVLEPVVGEINKSRLGLRLPHSEWFRIYRDFFLPSESYDVIFLKARIAILGSKGFDIMNLSDFKNVTIPQRDDPRDEKLIKRCESCRPMGMFRSRENEYLLCYDEFGLYVNHHGDPSRTKGTIEWEGTAEHVAWHPPYILIFDSRFIEVRHVETGRLCQVIPGNDLRCICDGRGASIPRVAAGPNGAWEEAPSQEARVQGVMRADDTSMWRAGPSGVLQHVFELMPLFLPEN